MLSICFGCQSNLLKQTFKAVTVLSPDLGAVCPVTLSRVYMQTGTLLEANVNRVETWAVRLWAADHAINFPSRRGRDRQVTENPCTLPSSYGMS